MGVLEHPSPTSPWAALFCHRSLRNTHPAPIFGAKRYSRALIRLIERSRDELGKAECARSCWAAIAGRLGGHREAWSEEVELRRGKKPLQASWRTELLEAWMERQSQLL